ncbi:MAG: hypothetical protein MUE46_07115 [Xanthomonadales bacterium]|jgi:hypothetical protein|nr:hypothetical protein [Xanthomonadales bacterium]
MTRQLAVLDDPPVPESERRCEPLRGEAIRTLAGRSALLTDIGPEVRERTPSANGGHSPGRMMQSNKAAEIARRLAPDDSVGRSFLQAWASNTDYGGIPASSPVIMALAGLDDVVCAMGGGHDQSVQVSILRPSLHLERSSAGLILKLLPPPMAQGSYLQLDPSKSTLTLVHYDAETQALAAALGKQAELPPAALPKLAALAPALQRKLPLANLAGLHARRVTARDTRLHVQVSPLPTGLRFQLRVRPLGDSGAFCAPGQGSREL